MKYLIVTIVCFLTFRVAFAQSTRSDCNFLELLKKSSKKYVTIKARIYDFIELAQGDKLLTKLNRRGLLDIRKLGNEVLFKPDGCMTANFSAPIENSKFSKNVFPQINLNDEVLMTCEVFRNYSYEKEIHSSRPDTPFFVIKSMKLVKP